MPNINDTPNTPGTIGYDDTKPATVSGSRPGVPVSARGEIKLDPETYAIDNGFTHDVAPPAPRPWASGHCAYDILNNATDLRLSLTVDGQNYTGLVARPGGPKEIAAMLRALAEQVESGRA